MSSQGSAAQLGMSGEGTIDERFDFISEDLNATTALAYNEGIRGSRSRHKERVRQGLINVAGTITLTPNPEELALLLPRILGGTPTGGPPTTVYPLADLLPGFNVGVDRIAKVHTYAGCIINTATFSASAGQPLQLVLDIIGKTESEGNAGSFPSLTIPAGPMYMFYDAASGLTLQGTGSRKFDEFSLTIDNMAAARFMNSQTATDISAQDRLITLSLSTPYTSSETDLYTTPAGSSAGAAAALVFTNGDNVLTFTFANLKSAEHSTPVVSGKTEILLPLTYEAYRDNENAELVVSSVIAA